MNRAANVSLRRQFLTLALPTIAFLALPLLGGQPASAQEFMGTGGFPTAAQAVNYGSVQQNPALISVDGPTGASTSTLTFDLIKARGGSQPTLALHYRSTDGDGDAGMGWSFGLPVIQRSKVTGITDSVEYMGQPLVPICTVGSGCPAGEVMPSWATTPAPWGYFRLEFDSLGARFFAAPSGKTWRMQLKSGETLEFGVPFTPPQGGGGGQDAGSCAPACSCPNPPCPLDLPADTPGSIDWDGSSSSVFRWNLVRRWDSQTVTATGTSVNVVRYDWTRSPEGCTTNVPVGYLTDVYDTPPAADAPLSQYAHHVRLTYESPSYSFVTADHPAVEFAVRQCRLARLDVTSFPFNPPAAAREVIRRYHLSYQEHSSNPNVPLHHSLLTSFQMEGACEPNRILEAGLDAPTSPACRTRPPVTMEYTSSISTAHSPVAVQATLLSPLVGGAGIGSVYNLSLVDVDGNGIPDLVETSTGPSQVVYINHPAIGGGAWLLTEQLSPFAAPSSPYGPTAFTLLGLPPPGGGGVPGASVVGDWWGDGLTQVFYMQHLTPSPSTCHFYERGLGSLSWIELNPPGINPCQYPAQVVGDINGDGLLDTTGPGSAGQKTALTCRTGAFGCISGAGTWPLQPFGWSLDSGVDDPPGISLSDGGSDGGATPATGPTIFTDLNGDGLADYAIANFASDGTITVVYSPSGQSIELGQPFGSWVKMASVGIGVFAPFSNQSWAPPGTLPDRGPWLHDLNGDGLADLIVLLQGPEVTSWGFGILWNVDGSKFDTRNPVRLLVNSGTGFPAAVLFGDVDGTGVDDLVYTDGTNVVYFDFEYLSSNNIGRPGVLRSISNGLGLTSIVTYAVSWGPRPIDVVQTLVTQAQETSSVARTWTQDYNYQPGAPVPSAIYDGWDHRVRGFRDVVVRTTSNTDSAATKHASRETTYALVECLATGGTCNPSDAGLDGPRLFPPLPTTIDDYGDTMGTEPSPAQASASNEIHRATTHVQWRAMQGVPGSDGRKTWVVFPEQVDTYLYDPTIASSPHAVTLPALTVGTSTVPETYLVYGSVDTGTKHLVQSQVVDPNGNLMNATDSGAQGDGAIVWSATYNPGLSGSWMWRMTSETTSQFKRQTNDPPLYDRVFNYSYDTNGNLTSVQSSRYQSPLTTLSRSATGALTPLSATQLGSTVTLVAFDYDPFGNAVDVKRPNGSIGDGQRCRTLVYDAQFNQLPGSVTDYTGGCFAGTALSTILSWDRGLAKITVESDPNMAVTAYSYDWFGRISSVTAPDQTTPGSLGATVMTASYNDNAVSPGTVETLSGPGFLWRQDIMTPAGEAVLYEDGTGQVLLRLREADPSHGDAGAWVASGWRDLLQADARVDQYDPVFYSGTKTDYKFANPSSKHTGVTLDVFGRPVNSTARDGSAAGKIIYRALSTDFWDSGNLDLSSTHYGQYSTTTVDGHGRATQFIKRGVIGGVGSDVVTTTASYLATGELSRLTKIDTASGKLYERWMAYDSLGRMVENAEPNASRSFSPDGSGHFPMWEYAYDDLGNLVGTADARGCGENMFYDGLGRLLAEDYSPCEPGQPAYTPPHPVLGITMGFEATYTYDAPELGQTTDFGPNAAFLAGHLAASSDRGSHNRYGYDGRGRRVGEARQVAGPAGGSSQYAPTWNRIATQYDDADRPIQQDTGADVPGLMAIGALGFESYVTFGYTKRGLLGSLGSSYGAPWAPPGGDLMSSYTADALGRPTMAQFGDSGQTQTGYDYDNRGRTMLVTTAVSKEPAFWTGAGSATYTPPSPLPPTVLEKLHVAYDTANNVTGLDDQRLDSEWPDGAKRMKRTASYDDAYQLTKLEYKTKDKTWTSPFDFEANTGNPGPVPGKIFKKRPVTQDFDYDYLGNVTRSDDNGSNLFDRSLAGKASYGDGLAPSRLTSADGGNLQTAYDAAGNMTALTIVRSGMCAAPTGACNQFFAYSWDEVGRLSTATRWDLTTTPPPPATPPISAFTATAGYLYSGSERVVHAYSDTSTSGTVYTVEIFPSVRLDGAHAVEDGSDYERTTSTEAVYLAGLGRVVYDSGPLSPSGNPQHIFLELADPIGSTDTIIDRETSELVERRTDQAFGAEETDYRPTRWSSFREHYRFTGKEDDIAFGLIYFGARYYVPGLLRWASPDPMAEHAALGDLNPYAYVGNSPLQHVDARGLDEGGWGPAAIEGGGGTYGGGPAPGNGPGGNGSAPINGGGAYQLPPGPPQPPPPPPPPVFVYGPPTIEQSTVGTPSAMAPAAGAGAGAGVRDAIIDNAKTGIWVAFATLASGLIPIPGGTVNAVASFPAVTQASQFLESAKAPEAQRGLAYKIGYWAYQTVGVAAVGSAAGAALGAVATLAEDAGAVAARAVAEGAAEGAEALAARAAQVHSVLDPIAAAQRTTAALDTTAGRIIAGGARDLTPAQRAALLPGEIAGKLPGAHAEVTALAKAQQLGATPQAIAVTRIICPQCAAAIEASGGKLTSLTTAEWP